MKKYNYNIHNFLTIKSDVGFIFPDEFLISSDVILPDIEINVLKCSDFHELIIFSSDSREVSPGIWINRGDNFVFSKISLFGFDVFVKIIFAAKGNIIIYLSDSYLLIDKYLLKMPFSSFFPLEHFLKIIMQVVLLRKGYSQIIFAGLEINNSSILITSFPGIGKTTTYLELLRLNKKYKYLGDDTLITDGVNIFSYPKNMRIRKIGTPFFSINKSISPRNYFSNLNKKAKISIATKLFFLEKGFCDDKIFKISNIDAINKYGSIKNKLMPLGFERLLSVIFYENFIDYNDIMIKERDILSNLISNLLCYVVVSSNYRYVELISQKLK